MVQVEDVFDLLQVLVLHAAPSRALIAWVYRVRNADLVHHDVAQVDVLSRQDLHQTRRLVHTQLFRNAHCNEGRVVVILELLVDFLNALFQSV